MQYALLNMGLLLKIMIFFIIIWKRGETEGLSSASSLLQMATTAKAVPFWCQEPGI